MNKLLELRVRILIERYKKKPTPVLREAIFSRLSGYIMATLKTSLKIHRRYRSDPEILSMAWDVFEEGVSVYVHGVKIRDLFGSRAILHVKRMVSSERRENKKFCSLDLIGEEYLWDDTQRVIATPMMDLREFRSSLRHEYRLVFDDALKSIGANNRYRTRDPRCPLTASKYYESKKVMQMIISYFLTSN